ncbi:MAG: phosphodiesterase [Firmicutes bacterium]|nr:phosphodiesterase [Bacillota bacterium]
MKRTLSFRPYVLIVILFVLIFGISDYLIIRSIEKNFLQSIENQYINYASIYSQGLTKTAEAYRIINDMLERRILSAIKTVSLYSEQVSNEILDELADSLAIDEIYWYNPEGVIEFATKGKYIGWTATPSHPVHNFMISELTSYVEAIRQDTESDEYYKYGYFKLNDGRFIQIGVHADVLEDFLAPFETIRMLRDMVDYSLVDNVYFINPDYSVTTCCNPELYDLQLDNPTIRQGIDSRTTFSIRHRLESLGQEIYEIFIPVFVQDEFMGTLVVIKSTKEADAITNTTILISIIVSLIVFASLTYIMLANYIHNKRLVTLAYKDSLTGLSNNTHLQQVLDDILAEPQEQKTAIVMIHCHNIGSINSTYGLPTGDKVLKEVANRLLTLVTDEMQLFRFSGNRFVLLIKNYQNQAELQALAEEIISILETPLEFIGRPIEIKIGIVELEPGAQTMEVLSKASMVIHYLEQGQTREPLAFFDTKVEEKLRREEIIAQELSEFLANPSLNTLYLEYQPKLALASNQIVGFEALSRMNSPTLGRISPIEFISIAERQEKIVPLGYWVLETACKFVNKLYDQGYQDLYVAVNISVIQLLQKDFPNKVEEIITKTGINPKNLQLEITESVFTDDFDDIQAKLRPLRELGLTIALDDFGTGYSTLSRMGELLVDFIKIDKSFIDKILLEDEQKQIVQELISLSHKLDLTVVAEGVEEEKQRDFLLKAGCDIMQGYLFSRPLPEKQALEKLKSHYNTKA